MAFCIPCIGHSFGLFLLLQTTFPGFNGFFQKVFFINLCLAEVTITSLAIIKRIVTPLNLESYYTCVLLQYNLGYMLMYEVMILITMERFCAVYYNIKLPLMWNDIRTKILAVSLWICNTVLYTVMFVVELRVKFLDTYMFMTLNAIFFVVAIPTYTYIHKKIIEKRKIFASLSIRHGLKPLETTCNQLSNSTEDRSKKKKMIASLRTRHKMEVSVNTRSKPNIFSQVRSNDALNTRHHIEPSVITRSRPNITSQVRSNDALATRHHMESSVNTRSKPNMTNQVSFNDALTTRHHMEPSVITRSKPNITSQVSSNNALSTRHNIEPSVITRSRPNITSQVRLTQSYSDKKQFLSVFLLVISLSIFHIIPDAVYMVLGVLDIQVGSKVFQLLSFSYSLSYTMDLLVYLLTTRPVRKTLQKVLRRVASFL